jgi:hypothetical protein
VALCTCAVLQAQAQYTADAQFTCRGTSQGSAAAAWQTPSAAAAGLLGSGLLAASATPSWSPAELRAFVGVSGAYDLAALQVVVCVRACVRACDKQGKLHNKWQRAKSFSKESYRQVWVLLVWGFDDHCCGQGKQGLVYG